MPAATHVSSDLLLFLGVAAVIVPLFARLHLSAVLGFLATGVLLGPFGLGALAHYLPALSYVTFDDPARMADLGDLGVAFLLFMIGLELSFDRLLRLRSLVFGLGPAQVGICSVAIGVIAYLLGAQPRSAIVYGTALALSSTAITLPALAERRLLNSAAGRTSFAILLFQDLAVAPLLFMLTLLSPDHARHSAWAALLALATGLLELALLVGMGRLVLKPLFRLVAQTRSSELFVAASLLVVIGAASATAALGQSMALGTFIAGLLLAETEFRRQIAMTIEPFQGLLLGLFFTAMGARLDFAQIAAAPSLLLGLVVGILVIKMLVVTPLSRLAGLPAPVAVQTALILAPSGEFALVLINQAMAGHLVAVSTGTNALIAATITMFAIPPLVRVSERFKVGTREETLLAQVLPAADVVRNHVLIVGYGRVGELVGQMLSRHAINFVAVDSQVGLVARERRSGAPIFFGDARRIELLRHCGINEARALVVTMDDASSADAVVMAARAERTDLIIVARARDAEHAKRLYALGVSDAVPETIESSLQLSEALLVDIGVPSGAVIASVHQLRDELRALLQTPAGG